MKDDSKITGKKGIRLKVAMLSYHITFLSCHIVISGRAMGVDHGGDGGLVPPEFGVGGR